MKKIKWFLVILLSLLLVIPPNALAEIVGTITYTEGRVDKLEAGGKGYVPVIAGDKVSSGDAIRTKSYSKAEITFDDDSVVRLGGSSQIKVKEYDIDELGQRKKGVIELDRGRIRAIVSSTKDKTPFDINTLNASGSVKGSDVFVSYQKSATGILVLDGALRTVNPAFPDNVINIREGNASFVPYDAPPQNPRTYLPMEKQRYELETGPTIREIEGMLEGEEITRASVRRIAGVVKIQPADSESWHAPIINEVLNVGDKVATESDGRIEISLDNGHILELKPNTQIILTILTVNPKTGDYENEFECESGKVIAKLRKIEGKSSFMIKTPTATCGVRGTLMYVEVLPNLTKVFFEGGDGFITSLISGITKIVNAGQTGSGDNTGNVTDPTDTTDEERSKFGSGWGDEGGDTYGYTPPPGDVGGDLTGPGFTVGGTTPDPGTGGGWQPFDIVKPKGSTSGGEGGAGQSATSTNIAAGFIGSFGDYWSFLSDDEPEPGVENSILGTLTAVTGTPTWSGTLAGALTGTYSKPEDFSLLAGLVNSTTDDGGSIYGFMGGATRNSWEGLLSSLYIDPSGIAGILSGLFSGTNDEETRTFTGTGDIEVVPMGPTDVSPGDISMSLDTSYNIPGYLVSIFDFSTEDGDGMDMGSFLGEFSLNIVSITGQSWGIWEGLFSSEYDNPRPLENWEGGLIAFMGDDFGVDNLLIGLLRGTDDFLESSLDLFITLFYLDEYSLTTLEGKILGNYTEKDSYYYEAKVLSNYMEWGSYHYEGIGVGAYEQERLTFSGMWGCHENGFDEGSLYYNDGGDINWAGEDFGFMGGSVSPWLEPAAFVAKGEFWYDNYDADSYIWNTPIYSFNYDDKNYTTYDVGAFFGFTGGIWNNYIMDGSAVALYLDPDGNAGYLTGDVLGFFYLPFYEDEGIWVATGTLTPTQMATGLDIDPEEFVYAHVHEGELYAGLSGDFLSEDFEWEGNINGECYDNDEECTFFIIHEDYSSEPWGIYDLRFGYENDYYRPEDATIWTAEVEGEGVFGLLGEDSEDWGHLFALAGGNWKDEKIHGILVGLYLTDSGVGGILRGDIFGIYEDIDWEDGFVYGTWIGESLGTFVQMGESIDFSEDEDIYETDFYGMGLGSFEGGGILEDVLIEGVSLSIPDQNWGIWGTLIEGYYEGETSPFRMAIRGKAEDDDRYFLGTIAGDWDLGVFSGVFRGLFMYEGEEDTIAAGSITGDVIGNYEIEGEEFQGVGAGEWVELTELDPEILGFDLDVLSDFVDIPITEVYSDILTGANDIMTASMDVSFFANNLEAVGGIWGALINGTYTDSPGDGWSLNLSGNGFAATLTEGTWSDNEWMAEVVNGTGPGGIEFDGAAGGTYTDKGTFTGVGSGTWQAAGE